MATARSAPSRLPSWVASVASWPTVRSSGGCRSAATACSTPTGRPATLTGTHAAEHGPYWEVGLACGMIYNWWMWRTRSLGDLILVHGTTNLALSLFVIATGRWTFWRTRS